VPPIARAPLPCFIWINTDQLRAARLILVRVEWVSSSDASVWRALFQLLHQVADLLVRRIQRRQFPGMHEGLTQIAPLLRE
jgi:hypothetical protein